MLWKGNQRNSQKHIFHNNWCRIWFIGCYSPLFNTLLYMANQLFEKHLKCPLSDYYLPTAIFPVHCFLFCLLRWGLWIARAENLSYQQHTVDLKIHKETVIIRHTSATAIHHKNIQQTQSACVHQMQLLAELCTSKLWCFAVMGNEAQKVVILNFIFLYLVSTKTSTITQLLTPQLKITCLITGNKINFIFSSWLFYFIDHCLLTILSPVN